MIFFLLLLEPIVDLIRVEARLLCNKNTLFKIESILYVIIYYSIKGRFPLTFIFVKSLLIFAIKQFLFYFLFILINAKECV